jgi:hypothetical protein
MPGDGDLATGEARCAFGVHRVQYRLPVTSKAPSMPSADQLKALLKAYAQGDEEQFHSVALSSSKAAGCRIRPPSRRRRLRFTQPCVGHP